MTKIIRTTGRDVGKDWENTLKNVFSRLSKTHVFSCHKLVDTGTAGSIVTSQPADYLISYGGKLAYLEAKASTTAKSFRPSMLRPKQRQTIIQESIMGDVPYFILFGDLMQRKYQLINGKTVLQKGIPPERYVLLSGDIENLLDDLTHYWAPKDLPATLKRCKLIIQDLR